MRKWLRRIVSIPTATLLRVACWLALVALPMMIISVFVPTVWPVMLALSLGQAIGTLSFLLYVVVVVRDLQLARRLKLGNREDAAG